ncbi:hypothetical protein Glove_123g80 [Diversispora epigaea]|uniref:Wax synthase domain-containing protein n=1 Tax=Diversispora epigaea TaxID=1348612 RepID=A0A397IYM9_9GLOM|nr:hypothetical protein Glove_123g80 [Diversispora epigaea]
MCGGEYYKEEWPFIINNPIMSTSLTDLWSNRWHQVFREIWVSLAYRPLKTFIRNKFIPLLNPKFKKIGEIFDKVIPPLGVFVLSGIFHEYINWTVTYQYWIPGEQLSFFVLQGIGVIMEKLVKQSIPSLRIPNWLGWIWTLGFICLTIPSFLNVWIRAKPW